MALATTRPGAVGAPGLHARRFVGRRHSLRLLALAIGPGILVMLGENDGPSMVSYAATGATYGVGFFVPLIILTFGMAYVVQEMVARIGIATHRGHAELIRQRFGARASAFTSVNLFVGNALTLVTEFVAIRAGAEYFGIPSGIVVGLALALVIAVSVAPRYATWERVTMFFAIGNLAFIPVALAAHPDAGALGRSIIEWGPLPGGVSFPFLTLVLANVGATITPWMLFFQQSSVVRKGLTVRDLRASRLDTALGAAMAAVVAIATVVATSVLFVHHVNATALLNAADFATALRPLVGSHAAALFALGMIEAGTVAAVTISASSGYAASELRSTSATAKLGWGRWTFASTAAVSAVIAAAIVFIPHAPLLGISLGVNVIAALMIAPALLFAMLLANDAKLMGPLRNSVRANVAAGAVVLCIALLGVAYAVIGLVNR